MSVHEKIRLVREAKGLTQEQVAEKLDMSPNGYGDIERGDSDIKLSKLEKIAELFEIELSELIGLAEKENLTINVTSYQENKKFKSKIYISSANSELEKKELIIELKDKELALKDKEIELKNEKINDLNRIIALLENKNT